MEEQSRKRESRNKKRSLKYSLYKSSSNKFENGPNSENEISIFINDYIMKIIRFKLKYSIAETKKYALTIKTGLNIKNYR